MARARIILEHRFAIGAEHGERVRASLLHAAAPLLLCRGVDQVLVPVPTERGREELEGVIAQLPVERLKFVQLVDANGTTLRRVRDFLEPLRSYAQQWPEKAFVSFSERFLYQLTLGQLERSAIAADSVQTLRGFVPIIDIKRFRGEALYRLAELIGVIATYEPADAPRGSIAGVVLDRALSCSILEMIESSEYRSIAATAGAVGFLAESMIALRRLRRLLRSFVSRSSVRDILSITSAAAMSVPRRPLLVA